MFSVSKIFRNMRAPSPSVMQDIRFRDIGAYRYIDKTPAVTHNKLIYFETVPLMAGNSSAKTTITSSKGKELGYHSYCFFDDLFDGVYMGNISKMSKGFLKTIKGLFDRSSPKKGVGEVLRLVSIIEMLENKIPCMEITSADKAIPFHFKYKLTPNIMESSIMKFALEKIKSNTKIDKPFRQQASDLLKEITPDVILPNNIREKANKFISTYIQENSKNWKKANFHVPIPMRLDSDTIYMNSEFFNKLMEKHQIKYTIK